MTHLKELFVFLTISIAGFSIRAQEVNPLTQWRCLSNIECVQQAITDGADINGKSNDSHQDPVLYRASLMGRVATVEALLNAGVDDVDAANFFGETPLDIAISRAVSSTSNRPFVNKNYVTITRLLQNHGATPPEVGSQLHSQLQTLDEMYPDDDTIENR